MIKKYKIGFNIGGLVLFLVIMIPNFYWFAIPAPNDILRADSITESLDIIASVFQVLMIIFLCTLINKDSRKMTFSPLIITTIISCFLYFVFWILYYKSITNTVVVLGLCIFPCVAFLFFATDRKNIIAVISIFIFMFCHLIYGIANFIL
ncbi:MAG: hypothetical protein ACERKZ_06055 [Lachnotalea sp.]